MKISIYLKIILLGVAILGVTIFFDDIQKAEAHPGNTAADGCHYCWTNCDYWGVSYGVRHRADGSLCNNSSQGWGTCTIDGKEYTDSLSANLAWQALIREQVAKVYPDVLERYPEDADYLYWYDKLDFEDCKKNVTISYSDMAKDIKSGPEYQYYLWLKAHKQNIQLAYIDLLGRTATDEEVNNWANEESNIEVIKDKFKQTDEYVKKNYPVYFYLDRYKWWILGIIGFLLVIISIQYYFERKSHSQK